SRRSVPRGLLALPRRRAGTTPVAARAAGEPGAPADGRSRRLHPRPPAGHRPAADGARPCRAAGRSRLTPFPDGGGRGLAVADRTRLARRRRLPLRGGPAACPVRWSALSARAVRGRAPRRRRRRGHPSLQPLPPPTRVTRRGRPRRRGADARRARARRLRRGADRPHRDVLEVALQVRAPRLSIRPHRSGARDAEPRPGRGGTRHRGPSARRLLRPAPRRTRRCRQPRRGERLRAAARRRRVSARAFWARIAAGPALTVSLTLVLEPPRPGRHVCMPLALGAGLIAGTALFVTASRRRPSFRGRRARKSVVVCRQLFLGLCAANEELLWRRLLLGELLVTGPVVALALSSAGFAIAHRRACALHAGTGSAFGAVYLATGFLGASIAAHWAYNTLVAGLFERGPP